MHPRGSTCRRVTPTLLLMLAACAPDRDGLPRDHSGEPAGEQPPDLPVETDPPDPEPSPIPRAMLTQMSAGLVATVAGAITVDRAPLLDLNRGLISLGDPACVERQEFPDGTRTTVACRMGEGESASGTAFWSDGPVSAPSGDELTWARTWLPVVGSTVDPGSPTAAGLPRAFLYGQLSWSDPDGQVLRISGTFTHLDGFWEGVHAARTWVDGQAENRLAAPGTWTGNGLVGALLEVGRLRSDDGVVLLTVDGAMSGLGGPFTVAQVLGGAWLAEGPACVAEPSGTWSLREPDGRWYDITFDPRQSCDGCGVVRSIGMAEAMGCLDPEDGAAITAAILGTIP